MKKYLFVAAAAAVTMLAAPLGAAQASSGGDDRATFAVIGDTPYGQNDADHVQFDATVPFLATINADPDVSRVVHVGDIHSGSQTCTEKYDLDIAAKWQSVVDPLVYTPGDNEWADCNKNKQNGGAYNATTGQIVYKTDPVTGAYLAYEKGNPAANLDLVRRTFFANPGRTLGQSSARVTSQATAYDRAFPGDKAFVENVFYKQADVVFVTVNIPGGSNNDQDVWYAAPPEKETRQQKDLRAARTDADLRWLDKAFGYARSEGAKGVVILEQADMWDPEKGKDHQSGYEPFVAKIAALTTAFRKPVLMFNGDSHAYRSDNPLSETAPCYLEGATTCASDYFMHPGYDVPNFHRVVVHGSTPPMEWLKVTIDHDTHGSGFEAFGPFSWSRQAQPQVTAG